VCGAALYIAAHIHGFRRKKADVVAVVHVGENTLQQRLDEFENTEAGLLTAEEFDVSAKQLEAQQAALSEQVESGEGGDPTGTLTCEHRDVETVQHFAHGMCRMCFVEYCQVSGGVHQAGLDPPAFVRAEMQVKSQAHSFLRHVLEKIK
jgi:transcription factor IIIB subunit 2